VLVDDEPLSPVLLNKVQPRNTSTNKETANGSIRPDYNSMSLSELKVQLSNYGVRGGSKKFMVDKLNEIWDALRSNQTQCSLQNNQTNNKGTEVHDKDKKLRHTILRFIKDNKYLHEAILLYNPIDLLELQSMLKESGITCSLSWLREFLIQQGVHFEKKKKKNK